jgi:hypothetical protein
MIHTNSVKSKEIRREWVGNEYERKKGFEHTEIDGMLGVVMKYDETRD